MGGITHRAYRAGEIDRDLNVASGKHHWAKDSQGNRGPARDASPAEKSAALDATVERVSTGYNAANGFGPGITAEQSAKIYAGMEPQAKAEAISATFTTLINQAKPMTPAALSGKAEEAEAQAEGGGAEEVKNEIVMDALHIYGGGFDRNSSSVYEHQPHAAFAALSGERVETTYEDQQNTPFSGENKNLRHYSPFTIALLPPKEVSDLNKGSATNKDPYSWSGLGKLATRLSSGESVMVAPKENTAYFSEAFDGDSERIGKRALQASRLDQAISELNMLVHDGQISTQTDHTLQGDAFFKGEEGGGAHTTPLISVAHVADIYMQLLQMFRTPPLLLLVNPTSMNVTYSKIQAHQERTRYGYVFQAWGEQLPVLNFAGRIGAYYGGESPGGRRQFMSFEESTHVSGVQEAARRVSPAFQNLMNLMKIYKNNAYIRDNVGGSQANHLIGMVEISYDGTRYIGHFDKLEFTFEESNNLGGVNFSFDFTATEIRKNADERHAFVKRMSNPNQGGRYGDGSSKQTFSTMEQFLKESEVTGQSGWDLQSNNDFNDENPDKEGTQSNVLDSWSDQVEMPSGDNKGEMGWGTTGIQRRKK